MIPGSGIEPKPRLREASPLTTAPSLLLRSGNVKIIVLFPVNYLYEGRKLILFEACKRRRYISYFSGSEQTTLERLKRECANGLLINLSFPNDSFCRTSTTFPLINVGRNCRNSATYTSVNCSKTLVRPP